MDVQPPIQKISEETHEHLGSPTLINSSLITQENIGKHGATVTKRWVNIYFHRIHGSINGSNGMVMMIVRYSKTM